MTLHTRLSYAKSGLRVVGFACLGFSHFIAAAVFLIVAEFIGVLEEIPSAYKGTRT